MRILSIGILGLPSGVGGDLATAHVFHNYNAVVVNPQDLETLYEQYGITGHLYYYGSEGLLASEAALDIKRINETRSAELERLLEMGGVLVCFMQPVVDYWYEELPRDREEFGRITNYDWLGSTAPFGEYLENLRRGSGDTIDFVAQSHPFAAYLRQTPPWAAFTEHKEYSHWRVLASAFGTNDVALTRRQGRGHIVFLPAGQFDGARELLESCIKPLLREKEPREKPTWVKEILVPGQKEIQQEIEHAETEIDKLQKKRHKLYASDEQLERWKWLLWETGKEYLEPVVRDALALIGCEVEPQPDRDSDGKVESESRIALLEVGGSDGTLRKRKLQELAGNIANFYSQRGVLPKGILVGNPFCKERLDDRPPKGTQQQLFAKELVEDAVTQSIAVLWSCDLYNIVCRILEGQVSEDEKTKLRQAIFEGKGLVRLLTPESAR